MNTNLPQNTEDQEIDLTQISKRIGQFFEGINTSIFRAIQFFIKKAVIILILFALGFGIGMYLDKTNKSYNSEITVTPNFESTDYLYSKIDLIQSKIGEGDTVFLKKIVGLKNPKGITSIKIAPINDVYKFIENKTENFELIKLMAENGDINKILDDELTSKNYKYHTISIKSNQIFEDNETIESILKYLNDSDYYKKLQKQFVDNIQIKTIQNDSIISQINNVLGGFSTSANSNLKSNQLVYYNENTQLNDILKTKENLIIEQGLNKLKLVGYDKIIKETSITPNIRYTKSLNGKLKFLVPFLFLILFIFAQLFIVFYTKQKNIAENKSY